MKCVVSLDGGGIRGIIPALVLAEIESRVGKPVSQCFDLMVGTSTGGILALCLGLGSEDGRGTPRYTAADLVTLYEDHGREIFARSLWKGMSSVGSMLDEKYPNEGLEGVLQQYFGNAALGEALTKVMVTSYDIQSRCPVFFKSWKKEWRTVEMRYAARATSAAPTYFEPALVPVGSTTRALIDGGVFINNPTVSAYVEARRIFEGETDFLVVSLGTGELVRPIAYKDAKGWGRLDWVIPLLDCMFDGVSDAADYQMRQLLGDAYVRLQTDLQEGSDDMDDASRGNIANLKREAEKLLKTHHQEITDLCRRLQAAA